MIQRLVDLVKSVPMIPRDPDVHEAVKQQQEVLDRNRELVKELAGVEQRLHARPSQVRKEGR